MDRNELKIEALRQRIAQLSVEHEDRAADYRVEITLLGEELNNLRNRVAELESADVQEDEKENPEEDFE
jgi:uncharacterized protein YeeX (DUF496 family)